VPVSSYVGLAKWDDEHSRHVGLGCASWVSFKSRQQSLGMHGTVPQHACAKELDERLHDYRKGLCRLSAIPWRQT